MLPVKNINSRSIRRKDGKSARAAVIGHPVKHSLSPFIFSFLARHSGFNLSYEAIDVKKNSLKKTLSGLKKSGYAGVSVTLPLKTEMIKHLDSVSHEAELIGAVNAVRFSPSGATGHNTDWKGFASSVKDNGLTLKNKTALIFGAGGAARAVCYALAGAGAQKIAVAGRKKDKALVLAEAFSEIFRDTGFEAVDWKKPLGPKNEIPDFWINTTPLGLGGNAENFRFPFRKSESTAIDLIYSPTDTPFLGQAKKCGIQTINGIGMLVNQAILTWEILFGSLPGKKALKTELIDMLGRPAISGYKNSGRSIYLTGFMGAGKSTVGKLIARRLKMNFLETDRLIEKKAGLPISGIFKKMGEKKFRRMEEEIIRKISAKGPGVIALGGGSLLSAANRRMLSSTGIMIYLKCSPAILAKRLAGSVNRPLLKKTGGEKLSAGVKKLLRRRLPYYKDSDILVDSGTGSPAETAGAAIAAIKDKLPGLINAENY